MSGDVIKRAAELLRRGELVAFPTETVYGLGGDATNAAAVRKIFRAKGRPSTNPLIVHVPDRDVARQLAARWDGRAEKLAEKFWPGSLTLVLLKSEKIAEDVTAGLPSVGLRIPDHAMALELLREFGGAVAAPSANRSNHVSPTTAQHVRDEFGETIPLILEGGACRVGIESTVLDLTGEARILRPGAITREMIEAVIGEIVGEERVVKEAGERQNAPGQMEVHYAPRRPAYRFEAGEIAEIREWAGGRNGAVILGLGALGPAEYAQRLYARLREADAVTAVILVEMPPDLPAWRAVRDRLSRATKPWRLSDMRA